MPNQDPAETSSLFSLSEIRERMKEKKSSALKTTKMNASIAAKIRTKAINNSSIIKITLKQNNKALALALSAAKREARELTKEKMLLQKEVKRGDFERACLRQKLSIVVSLFLRMHHKHNEHMKELQQFMNSQLCAVVELSSPSESDSCSLLPSDESTTDMTDNQADDNHPIRTAPKAMRIPLSQNDDDKCENGKGVLASTRQPVLPLQLPTAAVGKPLKSVAKSAVEKPSSSYLMVEPLASSERDGQPSREVDGTALDVIFGGNPSSIPQSCRSCSLPMLHNNNLGQCSEITNERMVVSLGHVTERRKHRTGFSASFRECSWMELSDNGPLAGLTLPKEMEPAEISQMGELVALKAQNKSYKKIKASEAEALKKASVGIKGRDSSNSKSKGNLDDCNKRAAPNTTQPKALGSNTKIVSNSTEVSAQVDHLEKIQPLNGHGQNKGHNSQCFLKTIGPSTVHAEELSFSENSGSNVKQASQHSDKAGACGKIPAVDLAPRKENEILKDLTNAAQTLCHSTLLEEPLMRRGARARKPVNYEEPKLNRKLRRGDPFANSDFFSCPIYKTRKKKMTKSEAISKQSSSDLVP